MGDPVHLRPLTDQGIDGTGVRIAIFDTGFDTANTAFNGITITAQHDFVFNDGFVKDQPNDQPGAQIQMRLRGMTTILGNTTPLYIVDGVTVYSIDGINPNDIQDLQILKGASAGAMYGSRASNGVVLITNGPNRTTPSITSTRSPLQRSGKPASAQT